MLPILKPLPKREESQTEYQKEVAHFKAIEKARSKGWIRRFLVISLAHVFVKHR